MPEYYKKLDISTFIPTTLMEPRRETIPVNQKLKDMNRKIAQCNYNLKCRIWAESAGQWEKEGKCE